MITALTTCVFTSGKLLTNREMVNFQKWDFLRVFLILLLYTVSLEHEICIHDMELNSSYFVESIIFSHGIALTITKLIDFNFKGILHLLFATVFN